jgi:hypothetical protein
MGVMLCHTASGQHSQPGLMIPTQEREAAEGLAHEIANRVSGTYRRSDLFDRREPLMRDWADHCRRGTGCGEWRGATEATIS